MRMQNRFVCLALVAPMGGCFTRYDDPAPNLDDLQQQVDDLKETVELLTAQLAAKADVAALADKADVAALDGLVDQSDLDAALALKQDAETAATDVEVEAAIEAASSPLTDRLQEIEGDYVTSADLAATVGGLGATYVTYDALQDGAFDTTAWSTEGSWFDDFVRLQREASGPGCDEDCIRDVIAAYEGPSVGLVTEAELAALDPVSRTYVDDQDAADRSWVNAQGYASVAAMIAGDAAERTWVADQGYATTAYVDTEDDADRAWVTFQGYTTENWVTGQGYVTEAWVAASYPEQAEHDMLSAQVALITADYVTSADIGNMATRTWVAAGYAEQAEHDALSSRVATIESDYLTEADLEPYAMRNYVDVQDEDLDSRVSILEGGAVLFDDLSSILEPYATETALEDGLASKQELLREDVVLTVSAAGPWDGETTFPEVAAALDWLNQRVFAPGVGARIQIEDGTYFGHPQIDITHEQGERISIVGNLVDETRVELQLHDSGVLVHDDARLGGIDGVYLHHVGEAGESGVHTYRGGHAAVGTHVKIAGFFNCLRAEQNSTITASGSHGERGVICDGTEYAALVADASSWIDAKHADITGGVHGVLAGNHSYVDVYGLVASSLSGTGLEATVGATINANTAQLDGAYTGMQAIYGAHVFAPYSRLLHIEDVGIVSAIGSSIHANSASIGGVNPIGAFADGGSFISFQYGSVESTATEPAGRYGLYARFNSQVYADQATVTTPDTGIGAHWDSSVVATRISGSPTTFFPPTYDALEGSTIYE